PPEANGIAPPRLHRTRRLVFHRLVRPDRRARSGPAAPQQPGDGATRAGRYRGGSARMNMGKKILVAAGDVGGARAIIPALHELERRRRAFDLFDHGFIVTE